MGLAERGKSKVCWFALTSNPRTSVAV